jgi:hypothetical protein
MLLFLGAGASKAVGIGDLKELTVKVNKELCKQGYGKVLKDIVQVLCRANTERQFFNEGEIDLEVTLSILNAKINHLGALKESGPYSIYLAELGKMINPPHLRFCTEDIKRIKKIVSRIITSACIKYDENKAKKYYGDLFSLKDEITTYKTATITVKGPSIFEHIVTTNYDLVIDNYYNKINKPLNRGFEKDKTSNDMVLNLKRMNHLQTESTVDDIQLVQLHGSIDWWRRSESGREDKIVLRENSKSYRHVKYPEQLMVYPIYEKHISRDPWFSLYCYFWRQLYRQDIYIVIGYSFRDPSINNAFGDALRYQSGSRMIIVNRNKTNILKRVEESFPRSKVEIIETEFGNNNLKSKLKEALMK